VKSRVRLPGDIIFRLRLHQGFAAPPYVYVSLLSQNKICQRQTAIFLLLPIHAVCTYQSIQTTGCQWWLRSYKPNSFLLLRVVFFKIKTDSGYPKDAGTIHLTLANPRSSLCYHIAMSRSARQPLVVILLIIFVEVQQWHFISYLVGVSTDFFESLLFWSLPQCARQRARWACCGACIVKSDVQTRFITSVLQCAAVCCSVLQRVAVRCRALPCVAVRCSALQRVAVCCSALQYIAVHCSTLQCVVVPWHSQNIKSRRVSSSFFILIYVYTIMGPGNYRSLQKSPQWLWERCTLL